MSTLRPVLRRDCCGSLHDIFAECAQVRPKAVTLARPDDFDPQGGVLSHQSAQASLPLSATDPRLIGASVHSYASLFGFGFLEPTMWRLIRHLHDRVDVSFCPSASTKAVLESKGFENVRIWSRGVDTSSFSPAAASSAQREAFRAKGLDAPTDVAKSSAPEVVAVYVGRLSFEKNLRLLVDAMRSLRFPTATNPACRVVFVGDGPARNAIESLCRQYGISATFMGHLRGQALAACFASADLFAFPSFSETFGQASRKLRGLVLLLT